MPLAAPIGVLLTKTPPETHSSVRLASQKPSRQLASRPWAASAPPGTSPAAHSCWTGGCIVRNLAETRKVLGEMVQQARSQAE